MSKETDDKEYYYQYKCIWSGFAVETKTYVTCSKNKVCDWIESCFKNPQMNEIQ